MKLRKWILIVWLLLIAAACVGEICLRNYQAQFVTVGEAKYEKTLESLDLSGQSLPPLEELTGLPNLRELDLRGTGLTVQQYEEVTALLPACRVLWEIPFQGKFYPTDTQALTVTELTQEDVAVLPYFTELKKVDAGESDALDLLRELRLNRGDLEVSYTVPVNGERYAYTVEELTLSGADPEEVARMLPHFPELKSVEFLPPLESGAGLTALRAQFPEIDFTWSLDFRGMQLADTAAELDLTGELLDGAALEELARALACLPQMKTVTLRPQLGTGEQLKALLADFPEVAFAWEVEFKGMTLSSTTTELDLTGIPTTAQEMDALIPCLPALTYVDMTDCGIDNETMDALRKRHEPVEIVWTVILGIHFRLRTDVTGFIPCKDEFYPMGDDLVNLRYCQDMIALDLGHMWINDAEFLRYMPHLRYLILADGKVRDLSPLEDLKELLFLELFMTKPYDLSPLLGCTALEDLNLSYVNGDPSVIAKMTWLKNLWWGNAEENLLSPEDQQMLRDAIPGCNFQFANASSTGNGWRKLPNYFAQRDELGMFYMSR